MSVLTALQDMFTCAELTHPVSLGVASARGIYDETWTVVPAGTLDVQVVGPMLYLVKDALAGLEEQVTVTVGALGAASAAGGRSLRVHRIEPVQDGLVLACHVGGGR